MAKSVRGISAAVGDTQLFWVVVAALWIAVGFLGVAPLVMPKSYRWIEDGVSESGAQGVGGAWVTRTGFVMFGVAVTVLAFAARNWWGRVGSGAHLVFGLSMFGVAGFSTRPWIVDLAYDTTEDMFHSLFATTMGFGLIGGVLAVMTLTWRREDLFRAGDFAALVVSCLVPLFMGTNVWGVLQRAMFATAALWYGREALRLKASDERCLKGGD